MPSNFSVNCSEVGPLSIVGPVQVFESLGAWNTGVYVILVLHLLPVWVVSILTLVRLPPRVPSSFLPPLSVLCLVPPSLMALTAAAILFPSAGNYVEVLLEIVLSLGLICFVKFSTSLCGGDKAIVNFCRRKQVLVPVGSPPFICLLPFRRPQVTKRILYLISIAPTLLFASKLLVLVTEVTFSILGFERSGGFFALENLHNLISFPVGIFTIYGYTIFNVLMNDCLSGISCRFLGVILLLEFVLFDCLRIFFIFLTGTGMLICVPPSLSQDMVVHLLKNYIKAFLATFVGIPFLALIAGVKENVEVPTNRNLGSEDSMLSTEDSSKATH